MVVDESSSGYRMFDAMVIIESLDSSFEGSYYVSDNGGNTNVFSVYCLTHESAS